MKKAVGLLAIGIFTSWAVAQSLGLLSIDHTQNIVQRPDGQFDVTCMDGVKETKNREDVLANRICAHLRTFADRWRLISGRGGGVFCDMDMSLVRNEDSVVKLQVTSSCLGSGQTQQCNGVNCALELNGKFFDFDFSVVGKATVTRMEDGVNAVYQGNGGGRGNANLGSVRVTEVHGVESILQASNDNGMTWKPVCDDYFDQNAAAVACREMGASGVINYQTGVTVYGDNSYGWDDLYCNGSENNLSDCDHVPWGQHDCGESEHVQLFCSP